VPDVTFSTLVIPKLPETKQNWCLLFVHIFSSLHPWSRLSTVYFWYSSSYELSLTLPMTLPEFEPLT